MYNDLKKAIVNYIIDNDKEFQIILSTKEHFREYIYNSKGDYLIGGEEVAAFIEAAIKLLANN